MRREASVNIEWAAHDMRKFKNYEWLKTTTCHIKGIAPQDCAGLEIEAYLNKILAESQYGPS